MTATEFSYSWPTDPQAEGLSPEGYEQVRLIIQAVQTRREDLVWPAEVRVQWTTVDMASVGKKDEVGITLSFHDDDANRQINQLQFRFPKKGIQGFSAKAYVESELKM